MPATYRTTERAALEREVHELIRTLRLTLDDLSAAVERQRQLRILDEAPPVAHQLVIEVGPCGRPEVVR